jgi:hypothetical protein
METRRRELAPNLAEALERNEQGETQVAAGAGHATLLNLLRITQRSDTPPHLAPALFPEGTQATRLKIPSRKRGARQGGVCWGPVQASRAECHSLMLVSMVSAEGMATRSTKTES